MRQRAAAAPAHVHVGCSGWNYAEWRGGLYPAALPSRSWLAHYAARFDTVEVNATFYRLIAREAVASWVQQTPPDFVFAVKASRYLTHVRRLRDVEQGVARFYERIEPLIAARRLGPVLWQLPESFRRDDDRLAAALRLLPQGRHAFEFRHASWFAEEVYALLREHAVALVVADDRRRPLPEAVPTTPWRYVRLHYGHRGRRGNYSEAELRQWAARIHRWRRDGELFVYLNNDWEGFAPRNATFLHACLAELTGERATPGRRASPRRRPRPGSRRPDPPSI